jgi:hypothetical protein
MRLAGFAVRANVVRAAGFVAFGLVMGLGFNVRDNVSAQAKPPAFRPRVFYMTKTEHLGGAALAACARGFHMASLWEIFEPSSLKYDTTLGRTDQDSGFGPPSDIWAWIRTGTQANPDGGPGDSNCNAWTSSANGHFGSAVRLGEEWERGDTDLFSTIQPWRGEEDACDEPEPVWCVEDR